MQIIKTLKNINLAKKIKVIAISETWLNSEMEMDFQLEGYECNFKNRIVKERWGCGSVFTQQPQI